MKSDQTPKPPRCQSGVSSITGELAARGWGGVLFGVEGSLLSPDGDTPIRRPADTFPLPAAHFERNEVTIICETVH